MNTTGNTKKVEQCGLKELYPCQELLIPSTNKRFTRHYSNVGFYLPPSEYVLFNWLVYYSDQVNVITYSAELLKLYDKACSLAIKIYKPEKVTYTTSMDSVRDSFISLVEKGLIIKMSAKSKYMMNPYMVFSNNFRIFPAKLRHTQYLAVITKNKGDVDGLQADLTKYCDGIAKDFAKKMAMDKVYLERNKEIKKELTK